MTKPANYDADAFKYFQNIGVTWNKAYKVLVVSNNAIGSDLQPASGSREDGAYPAWLVILWIDIKVGQLVDEFACYAYSK